MKLNVKECLLIFVFIILLLPFVQQCLPFESSGNLNGYYNSSKDVKYSWEQWFDGTYQTGKKAFCNDHVGFRQDMIRFNNQVDFSIFSKCHSLGAVLGKDRHLFLNPYIDAYFGKDFCGYDTIHHKCVKLKAIQDTFDRMGKSLIMLQAR